MFEKHNKQKIAIRDKKSFDKDKYIKDLQELHITRPLLECDNVDNSYDLGIP